MPDDNSFSAHSRCDPSFLSLREGTEQLARHTLVHGNLPVPLPQLNKLRELRDALVALKGPLAEKSGLCERIESVFFNNEVNDRVLGKRVSEPLDIYRPARTALLDRREQPVCSFSG